eukprot:9379206-Pyramimonas_sp.AAC.1
MLLLRYHYCSSTAQPHNTAALFLQTTTKALQLEDATTLLEYYSRGLLRLHVYSAPTRANPRV